MVSPHRWPRLESARAVYRLLAAAVARADAARSPWLIWACRTLLIALLFAAAFCSMRFDASWAIPPGSIAHESGTVYSAALPRPYLVTRIVPTQEDNSITPGTELRQNGQRLGPLRLSPGEITAEGSGQYSRVRSRIFFTASDNTDPRTNAHAYIVRYQYAASGFVPLALAALLAALLTIGLPPLHDAGFWPSAKRRLGMALFDLEPRPLLIASCAAAALVLGVATVVSREFAFDLLDSLRAGLRDLIGAGFSFAGLIVAAQILDGRGLMRLRQAAISAVLVFAAAFFSKFWWLWLIIGVVAWFIARDDAADAVRRLRAQIENLTLRQILLAVAALTVVMSLPEVVRYWDQSGWMDSRGYDELAHRIATGEAPFGSNSVMPGYQYGLAVLYWTFGHFFFVQQIGNIAMAVLGTLAFTVAAHKLYSNAWATVLAGVFVACWPPFRQYVWYTQIESWYVPLFAVSLLALVHYRQNRTLTAAVLLALASCAIFNMRLQGAFYAAALGLAPFVVSDLQWRQRLRHLVVFGAIFVVVGVAPWSIRNAVVDGRLSPSSIQSMEYTAILNDPRVPLYGLRWWERTDEVRQDWAQRYPDLEQRLQAQGRYFWDRLIEDPAYFVKAFPFRLMAFYGVLPGGYLSHDAAVPPELAVTVLRELRGKAAFWAPIGLSVLGLVVAAGAPFSWFLALLVFANAMICLLVGGATEPRFAYPALLLHFLIGLALFSRYRAPDSDAMARRWVNVSFARVLGVGIVLTAGFGFLRLYLGGPYAFRSIMAESWIFNPRVTPDPGLPELRVSAKEHFLDD